MHYAEKTKIRFPNLDGLDFMISYSETDRKSHIYEIDLHTHESLEIYINLTGDVSFLVENNLYPLNRGDIIIARPGEYHHCVYRTDAKHKLFWILLDCNKYKDLFNFFFDGTNANFISPDENSREEIIDCCYQLLNKELPQIDKFYNFFKLFNMLKTNIKSNDFDNNNLPNDFISVLKYIDRHLSQDFKVADIATALYLSESTIERRFREYLHIKPIEFIRKKKMILAAELLRNGQTVLNVGTEVGYSDNSYFIKLFKEYYGVTPLQYRKGLPKSK